MLSAIFKRLSFVLPLLLTAVALAEPHKLRVTDRALADELIAQGGRRLADYPSFQLIEVDEVPITKKPAAAGFQVVDQFNFIQLNAESVDTRAPQMQLMSKTAGAASGEQLRLVQFVGPVKAAWRAALVQTGVQILDYLPQNAFLVYGDAAALARLQVWAASEPVVQWTGDYVGGYKVHPGARAAKFQRAAQDPEPETFTVQLVADKVANVETLRLIGAIQLAPVVKSSEALGFRNVVVALSADQLDVVAAQADVVSIHRYYPPKKHDERQAQILAGNLKTGLPSGPGYLDWLASRGFTQAQFDASGFIVDVSDSGIDNGTITPGHFALYPQADVSQPSRVAYSRFERTVNHSGATLSGCDGHGNLNAHIIAGYDAFTGFSHTDFGGYSYGLGVCPFVKVGASVIFDNSRAGHDFTNPDYARLLRDAYNNGARISNNSWGGAAAGDYDSDAQQYDALVRDVNGASGQQPMVVLFVAGNDGPNPETIDSPGSAKNVITVGASENVRSLATLQGGNSTDGNDGCGNVSDLDANSANDVASFSGCGPCADGRFKPDLVAPGTHITGAVPQAGAPTTNGFGNALSCFNAAGVCALPGSGTVGNANNYFPLGQEWYTVSTGTSHAAPAVAGACALVRQYFINHGLEPADAPPSPAMTKAFLMNSARYLTGNRANDTLPSPNQGMGEVDLGTAFDGVARVLRDQVVDDVLTNSGQTVSFSGFVSDPAKPFRVTAVWTDAAGSISASRELVNDLDLQVTVGGVTYLGNVFSGARSVAGGTADDLNNVESVFLPAGVRGTFVVTVNAANIVADAISSGASAPRQDFALVVYNATLASAPGVSVSGYAVVAEDCAPANGVVDPDETVTVNFTLQNLGSVQTTDLKVRLLETNGIFAPSAEQTVGVLITNGASVTVPFTFTAHGACGENITATFALWDGDTDLGEVVALIPLGTLTTIYQQNFDGSAAPKLPPWWTTTRSNGQALWVTSKSKADTAPNAAFSSASTSRGVNALISPVLPMPASAAQLVFRHNYDLEAGFDGGVLEIKIGTNAFTDVLAAGGSFAEGGYNSTIKSSTDSSPLVGRAAWSDNSGGFITTTVNLPAEVAGQRIQFQWRCGTDRVTGGGGWWVDSVQIKIRSCCPDQPPTPAFIPTAGAYHGLFYDPNGVQLPSSGSFAATVTGSGAYSGSLKWGTQTLPAFSGTFDPFGAATNSLSRGRGVTPLQLRLQMAPAHNDRILGTVSDGTWLANLDAERSAWDTRTNPAPFTGKYTLLFPGSGMATDTNQPPGDGFGVVTVTSLGQVSCSGTLADGTAFSQSAKVSQLGQWPLYVSLNSGKGQLLGWLNFSNTTPNLSGVFNWTRLTNAAAKFYPAGFSVQTNAVGSAYRTPATGGAWLNFTNGMVRLIDGNYFADFANAATNTPASLSTYRGTNKLSFKLNSPSAGLFKGSIVDPVSQKTISFSGALLQTQQVVSGFFLGTNQSGKVSFGP